MKKRKNEHQIFLSYSQKDSHTASQLVDALEKRGLRVWYDKGKLRIGDSFLRGIEKALEQSDYFILLLSPEYLKSQWTNFEMGVALTRKNHIFPIFTQKLDPKLLPPLFSTVRGISVADHSIEEIASMVSKKIKREYSTASE
jgi:hypothetical protein